MIPEKLAEAVWIAEQADPHPNDVVHIQSRDGEIGVYFGVNGELLEVTQAS